MSSHASSHARIDYAEFAKEARGVYVGLAGVSKAVNESGFDRGLTELIKVRASQINGCAFCTQFHLDAARKVGVPALKLDLVAVWRDAGVFSEKEMAALAWTEALTHVAQQGAPDALYEEVSKHFSESECMFLTASIAVINAWNRIGVALRFDPPVPSEAGKEKEPA